eukprot:CAMPEP_0172683842 /NCGR_PEP_ID=MMETSP1074-20121228/19134_1 /TAXON_ID=2916 /ORGANISM="Ceratium fusus, Strain PA161109" /LENGTH=75 /DNA_ID=CAMNT_0013502755 /DNA_START=781 /DNA_END=1008 /DNA_ORIENTATION=+
MAAAVLRSPPQAGIAGPRIVPTSIAVTPGTVRSWPAPSTVLILSVDETLLKPVRAREASGCILRKVADRFIKGAK